MKVEQITPKSNKLKDIREYIAEVSSVVRDKQPKSAEKLFSRLLTESVGDKASRVLEYIPCTVACSDNDEVINLVAQSNQIFGFFTKDGYHTNARELLNWGWGMQDVMKTVDFTNYVVFKCETPYFIYGQVSTHNQLTTVSHSQRYADCERGYWCPPEIEDVSQDAWNHLVENAKPCNLTAFMKNNGVVRKEVFDRGRDMLQNRVFTIGGYTNNPNAWKHFLLQRMDKHTQLETQEFANILHDRIDV